MLHALGPVLAFRGTELIQSAFPGLHTMLSVLEMFFFLPSQHPFFVVSLTGALAIPYDNGQLCVLFICVAGDIGNNEKATGSECRLLLVQIPGSPLTYLTPLFKFMS